MSSKRDFLEIVWSEITCLTGTLPPVTTDDPFEYGDSILHGPHHGVFKSTRNG